MARCAGYKHSMETRAKIGLAHIGILNSPEARAKISAANIRTKRTLECKAKMSAGQHNKPPITSETRKKISIANKGKTLSLEHRAKISAAKKGTKMSVEARANMSAAHVGHQHGPKTIAKIAANSKNISDKTRQKLSDAHKKENLSLETIEKMRARTGLNAGNWKGGISFEPYCPKFNADLKSRIRAFFDHRCIVCGKSEKENGECLSCHHVEYNKLACCDGKPIQFATLCRRCHPRTNGNRSAWEENIHRIIDEIYDGKSYYTTEEFQSKLLGTSVTRSDMKEHLE
jgi:hypothetical protein